MNNKIIPGEVLIQADARGRINLRVGRPNWRYRLTEEAHGLVLTPIGPVEKEGT